MIILYNFENNHFAIACTGLKDCSFVFGFNSSQSNKYAPTDSGHLFVFPPVIHPYLDLNHYNLGHSAPKRVGIPSIEDGNPYGPSECEIYQWLFFGEHSYATIMPVGPASLLDSIWHAPARIARMLTRPIDKLYVPMGLGLLPVIDSAHCLDMIRWMLRVGFWNRDYPADLATLGLSVPPLREGARPNAHTPINRPRSSAKANHLMRMSYLVASGPGFNSITAPFLFMMSANKLRSNVIEANRAAGYDIKEGKVIEAPGAGTYAKYFGRTWDEKLDAASFQGGLTPRQSPMSPIYQWEVYQTWVRNFVIFDPATQMPQQPIQYKRIDLRQTPSHLKQYFCPSQPADPNTTYPEMFKFNLNYGEPSLQGQFYGRPYMHDARATVNWTKYIERGKDFAEKGVITQRIEKRHEELLGRTRVSQIAFVAPIELENSGHFYNELLKMRQNLPANLRKQPNSIEFRCVSKPQLHAYILSLIRRHYLENLDDTQRIKVAEQLTDEMLTKKAYQELNSPNATQLLAWLNKRAHELVTAEIHAKTAELHK